MIRSDTTAPRWWPPELTRSQLAQAEAQVLARASTIEPPPLEPEVTR